MANLQAIADEIKRAEFQEAVKQALLRLLDDPQVKAKIRAFLKEEAVRR
jgi:hypothetical protein